MLKMRLQGTKKDIRWFLKKIERDKRWRIANVSDFLADSKLNGKCPAMCSKGLELISAISKSPLFISLKLL